MRVHEQGAELRESGAGIVLWHNSLRVLEAFGARDAVLSNSMTPPYYETRIHNETVSREDFDGLAWRTMTRGHLYNTLLDAARHAGAEIVPGSKVESADPDGSVTLATGERLDADLVIGADGVKSNVRESIGFPQERTSSRDGITRFLVPRHKAELGEGDWDNVIDFWNFEPRVLRVLYVPCNDDELYIALMAPRSNPVGTRVPIDLELWADTFPHLYPVLRSASLTPGRYYGYETTKVTEWTHGRVALIGDSAHAMCPALAQGAGCAMANAYTVAEAADTATDDDMPAALRAWEASERGITDRCQERSAHFAATRDMSKGNQFTLENLETAMYDPTRHDLSTQREV